MTQEPICVSTGDCPTYVYKHIRGEEDKFGKVHSTEKINATKCMICGLVS